MSGILNSGKLSTLISRLTSTRASNLDNLDSAVSDCTQSSVWTNTKAGYLDAAVSSVGGESPPTSIVSNTSAVNVNLNFVTESSEIGCVLESVTSGSTANTYKVMKSVSGSGVISFLSICCDSGAFGSSSPGPVLQARLKIDGNVVWTSDAETLDGNYGWIPVGLGAGASTVTYDSVPFSTSFSLEFRNTTDTTTDTMYICSRYRLTS